MEVAVLFLAQVVSAKQFRRPADNEAMAGGPRLGQVAATVNQCKVGERERERESVSIVVNRMTSF